MYDLSEIIKSDKLPGEDYLVIDVRDDDFVGGNIPNCRNAPSVTFADNLDDLIHDSKNVPQVIFHCALSQSRAPKAAQQYAYRRNLLQNDNDTEQRVLILRGGFVDFQAKFKDDPKLVEKWNKKIWTA
ncbi:Rhodanese-like protein [Russula dissimulans]|nr:Rhodanese-like protein [Russula dissimulans]